MEHDRLNKFMTLIVSASRSVTKLKGRYMSEYGLGSTHTMCIRRLFSAENGLTRTQLAEECELDKAQVSRIINELANRGCIVENPGKTNYKRRIVLTDEGKRIASDINTKVLRINEYVSNTLSEEEISTFYNVFEKICENLRAVEKAADNDIMKGN